MFSAFQSSKKPMTIKYNGHSMRTHLLYIYYFLRKFTIYLIYLPFLDPPFVYVPPIVLPTLLRETCLSAPAYGPPVWSKNFQKTFRPHRRNPFGVAGIKGQSINVPRRPVPIIQSHCFPWPLDPRTLATPRQRLTLPKREKLTPQNHPLGLPVRSSD